MSVSASVVALVVALVVASAWGSWCADWWGPSPAPSPGPAPPEPVSLDLPSAPPVVSAPYLRTAVTEPSTRITPAALPAGSL